MDIREGNDDEKAIRALIGAHFQGLKWTPTTQADGSTFAADVLADASLFPAARPAPAKTRDEFIERMNSVAQGSLRSFEERTLGMQILVFGNMAVVSAAAVVIATRQPAAKILRLDRPVLVMVANQHGRVGFAIGRMPQLGLVGELNQSATSPF